MNLVMKNSLTVSLDNSLQNISSHTPEHHFQWTKWDDDQVIHGLLEKYAMERKSFKGGRPSETDPAARLTERHFPTYIPPTAKKKFPSRVCPVCPGRKETRWECKQCRNIPLHPEGCFEVFHTKRKY